MDKLWLFLTLTLGKSAAMVLDFAPYVVAGDRTLREIAATRPASLEELGTLYGIGPAKVERYGPGLLEVVARTPPRSPVDPRLTARIRSRRPRGLDDRKGLA